MLMVRPLGLPTTVLNWTSLRPMKALANSENSSHHWTVDTLASGYNGHVRTVKVPRSGFSISPPITDLLLNTFAPVSESLARAEQIMCGWKTLADRPIEHVEIASLFNARW
ncbi:hypothetical protein HS088_TW01G00661 [Tripterygium wilfordii]|uniref:Uncharacterized protein n=1 Tax=Tripterygium wilfordii TaxID=458696 RepID=A0A7J7E2I3_TRIWF|nr:hypothetical protein HS088_TW01G00661 [Tripterygium wilfordii]